MPSAGGSDGCSPEPLDGWGGASRWDGGSLKLCSGVNARMLRLRVSTTRYPLERAVEALSDLREGRLEGAVVLIP